MRVTQAMIATAIAVSFAPGALAEADPGVQLGNIFDNLVGKPTRQRFRNNGQQQQQQNLNPNAPQYGQPPNQNSHQPAMMDYTKVGSGFQQTPHNEAIGENHENHYQSTYSKDTTKDPNISVMDAFADLLSKYANGPINNDELRAGIKDIFESRARKDDKDSKHFRQEYTMVKLKPNGVGKKKESGEKQKRDAEMDNELFTYDPRDMPMGAIPNLGARFAEPIADPEAEAYPVAESFDDSFVRTIAKRAILRRALDNDLYARAEDDDEDEESKEKDKKEDDDEKPKKSKKKGKHDGEDDENDEEKPKKSQKSEKDDDEDDEEKPKKSKSKSKSKSKEDGGDDDDDDQESPKSKKKGSKKYFENDDEEDEEDEKPKKSKSKSSKYQSLGSHYDEEDDTYRRPFKHFQTHPAYNYPFRPYRFQNYQFGTPRPPIRPQEPYPRPIQAVQHIHHVVPAPAPAPAPVRVKRPIALPSRPKANTNGRKKLIKLPPRPAQKQAQSKPQPTNPQCDFAKCNSCKAAMATNNQINCGQQCQGCP
jgi:hypothetical protein